MPRGDFRANPQNINRKGRPKKGETFTDVIMAELSKENVSVDDGNGKKTVISAKEAVVRKLIKLAVAEGSFPAIKYLMDRIDGSPRQTIELGDRETEELSLDERQKLIEKYENELKEVEGHNKET